MLAGDLKQACETIFPGWQAQRKIDAHMHVPGPPAVVGNESYTVDKVIEAADKLGISQLCISVPIAGGRMAPMADVRLCNDYTFDAMRRYPDRFLGYCFLIPGYFRESLDEAKRCLDHGMIGIKLYNQYKYSEPVLNPIAEMGQ